MLRSATASPAEVVTVAAALQRTFGSLPDAFHALDVRGSGYLTQAGWVDGLSRIGYSQDQAEMLFRSLDRSRMGSLTVETFLNGFSREERLQSERTKPPVVRQRSSPLMSTEVGTSDVPHSRNGFPGMHPHRQSGAIRAHSPLSSPGPAERSMLRGPTPPVPPTAARAGGSLTAPTAQSGSTSDLEQSGRLLRAISAHQSLHPTAVRGSSEARHPTPAAPDMMQPSLSNGGQSAESQVRLEERVAGLHKSLESMLQESVRSLAQGLRQEWRELLLEEQEKFSMRTTAIGQALMKEMEGKLLESARAEAQAAMRNEVRGLLSCFALGCDGADEASHPDKGQFREMRAGLARFEQRVVDRAAFAAQPPAKLAQMVAAISKRQDDLDRKLAAMTRHVCSASTTTAGSSPLPASLDATSSDVVHCLDMTQTLDLTVEACKSVTSEILCDTQGSILPGDVFKKLAGNSDHEPSPQVENLLDNMYSDVRRELDAQRSMIESMMGSMESFKLTSNADQSDNDSSGWSPPCKQNVQANVTAGVAILNDGTDSQKMSSDQRSGTALNSTEVLDMLDVLKDEVLKMRMAKGFGPSTGPGRNGPLETLAEESMHEPPSQCG
mmetsp:Transcript_44188/g.104607  ORF Transcript_44188/g.104607 Transcript_44188/m.104607 type:complete len:610 (-) Transcript_44188:185-2014(-)|eukprot:CAMPEP_0178436216 /NCGR_PEP_ID=MMETSP0689_2-20121128/34326_1 /TAXON_ID=160604 /ORGANISM="Amphidinium massartii, Strain CS-259" /LENGTH=609 /DNA_ID=CAMNT_0020058307 /DNA_START=85 /DNA_END=1914 /DNA_ORIENTATION=+